MAIAPHRAPGTRRLQAAAELLGAPLTKTGHIALLFARVLTSVPAMLTHYRREFMRILADIAWGNGSIVVGGGTVGVAVVLGMTAGALAAVEG